MKIAVVDWGVMEEVKFLLGHALICKRKRVLSKRAYRAQVAQLLSRLETKPVDMP